MTDSYIDPTTPAFPVLDAPRTFADAELGRVILGAHGHIEPHLAELDGWCSMPVRVVLDQANGYHLELGPYSLDAADVAVLRQALAAYDKAFGR